MVRGPPLMHLPTISSLNFKCWLLHEFEDSLHYSYPDFVEDSGSGTWESELPTLLPFFLFFFLQHLKNLISWSDNFRMHIHLMSKSNMQSGVGGLQRIAQRQGTLCEESVHPSLLIWQKYLHQIEFLCFHF